MHAQRGIMIFQDFMFSVNVYPGSEAFLRNCEVEIKQQVRRLRNYACLGLWSGNNEILQGIQSWGWGSDIYRKNYDLLFEKLIRKILEIESPDISYIPSSPQFGSGWSTTEGDIHSWSVWAGGASFDNYEHVIGRFNS
jgi:beta-mannosidase